MINTAQLQRLDRASIESKAVGFSVAMWLVVWLAIGVSGRFLWGDWYGFGAGFVIAPVVALPLMWLLFARPSVKEKRVVRASWAENSLRIYDPIEDRHETIDFSKAHKAILILCKAEGQFLLRLEQIPKNADKLRIDILGPTPMVLPMRTSGDARSLHGFYKLGEKEAQKATPYRLKDNPEREDMASSLLAFVDSFREQRNNDVRVRRGDESIRISDNTLALAIPGKEILFADPSTLTVKAMARPAEAIVSTVPEHADAKEILLALIPATGPEDALVFSTIALGDIRIDLPSTWDVPESAMARKFTLYDDSVNTFIVTRTLTRYLKRVAPNNPVLEILRN